MPNSENKPLSEKAQPLADFEVNALNLACPMPLLKMKQTLNRMDDGQTVLVKATDPASERDFSAYIAMTPHTLISRKIDSQYFYWVTKNSQG